MQGSIGCSGGRSGLSRLSCRRFRLFRPRGATARAPRVAGGDSDRGYFVVATSDDDGQTWLPPRLVIDPSDAPGLRRRALVGNLWGDPTGRLWLFFDQSMGYFDGRAGVWAITCDHPDAADPEWSPPRRLWHGATLNKPTILSSGEWRLPVSLWSREKIRPPGRGVPEPPREEEQR